MIHDNQVPQFWKFGGRTAKISSGYRPDHVFERAEKDKVMQAFMEDIQFEDQDCIQPGETKVVTVRFLRNKMIGELAKPGKKWLVHEGPNVVGEGEIIKLANI